MKILLLLALIPLAASAGITAEPNASLSAQDLGLTKYSYSIDAKDEVLIVQVEKTVGSEVVSSAEWIQASHDHNLLSIIYGAPVWGGGAIILAPGVAEKWEEGVIYGLQKNAPNDWTFVIRRRSGPEEQVRLRVRSENYSIAKNRRPDLPSFPSQPGESWGQRFDNQSSG